MTAAFVRYEYLDENGQWSGIFRLFDPSERRFLARYIHAPKWYRDHPGVPSRCWFTRYGNEKYGSMIQDMLVRHQETWGRLPGIRIRQADELPCIAMHGRIQCIELAGQ